MPKAVTNTIYVMPAVKGMFTTFGSLQCRVGCSTKAALGRGEPTVLLVKGQKMVFKFVTSSIIAILWVVKFNERCSL